MSKRKNKKSADIRKLIEKVEGNLKLEELGRQFKVLKEEIRKNREKWRKENESQGSRT